MQLLTPGEYELDNFGVDSTQTIQFYENELIDDPSAPFGDKLALVKQGTTLEEVLEACLDRLKRLDERLPSQYNKLAISHLTVVLQTLGNRTKDRVARGVEGTHEA